VADTHFASVALLLHCNGSDASTTFTDTSPTPTSVSVGGNAQVDTADKVFGTGSALFDGTGDYLAAAYASDFAIGTAIDFTVEFWVKLNAAGANVILAQQASGTGTYPWQVWFEASSSKFGFRGFASNGSTTYAMQQTGTSTTGVWYHLAAVRDGTTFRFFVDGVANGTATLAGNLFSSTANPSFGASNNGVASLNGWMDDIRFTRVARYTAGFTPPSAEFDDFGFTDARLSDGGLPSAPSILAAVRIDVRLLDGGLPMAPASVVRLPPTAYISDSGLPLAPTLRAWHQFAIAQIESVLGPELINCFHDFRPLVHNYPVRYTMDLVTPSGNVRVPISSWQATIQTESDCYAGCVIPKCADWLEYVYEATEFIVYRRGTTLAGDTFEHQMVRAPLTSFQVDQGPTNHTASLQGYFDALAVAEDPHERYDTELSGVRSVSNYNSGLRMRTAIDWLLQPAQRALYGETDFVVSYMNFYVNGADEYCDVGRRETEV